MQGAKPNKIKFAAFVFLGLLVVLCCVGCAVTDDGFNASKETQNLAKPDLAGLEVGEARDRLRSIGWDVDAIVGYGSEGEMRASIGTTDNAAVIGEVVSRVDYNVTQGSGLEETIKQEREPGSCVISYEYVSDDVLERRYSDEHDSWMFEYSYYKKWLASGEERAALVKSVAEWRDGIVNYDPDSIPLSKKGEHQEMIQLASDLAAACGV